MSDSDPEKYSIDEMMERLKSRGRDESAKEPQLVTREDGTRVMRVRKRKRRSKQPHKEDEVKRRKRGLVTAAVLTAGILVIALSGLAWILYLNSSAYREGVSSKMSEWTGAEIGMSQFRATPVSVGAGKIEMKWPDDQPAASLVLNGVRGDLLLSSHFTGDWRGERMVAGNGGELVLRAAAAGSPDATGARGVCPFQFGFEATRFNVKFGGGDRPALAVMGAEASFQVPDPAQPVGNIVLQGGNVRIGNFGAHGLSFASIQLTPEGVRVGNIQLFPESDPGAKIRFSGENLPLILTRGGTSELRMTLHKMPSVSLLGPGLGRIVDGMFETPDSQVPAGRAFFDVTDLSSVRIEAPIQTTLSSVVTLHDLPLTRTLGEYFERPALARQRFESEGRAVLKRDGTSVKLESLSLVSQRSLRISGSLEEREGGVLSGDLEVGMPVELVTGSTLRAVPVVFGRREGGFRWAKVKVSGTVAQPVDDLAEQLSGAMNSIPPTADGPRGLDAEWDDITRPAGER